MSNPITDSTKSHLQRFIIASLEKERLEEQIKVLQENRAKAAEEIKITSNLLIPHCLGSSSQERVLRIPLESSIYYVRIYKTESLRNGYVELLNVESL